MRKPWATHWMEEALHAAEMSTCKSGREVGAVFVQDNRAVISGFNGVPAKYPHPEVCLRRELGIPSGQEPHKCGCAHAEANSIANAARIGVALKGCVVYCTTKPCTMCMGALANVGVAKVIYLSEYDDPFGDDIALHAGIELERFDGIL